MGNNRGSLQASARQREAVTPHSGGATRGRSLATEPECCDVTSARPRAWEDRCAAAASFATAKPDRRKKSVQRVRPCFLAFLFFFFFFRTILYSFCTGRCGIVCAGPASEISVRSSACASRVLLPLCLSRHAARGPPLRAFFQCRGARNFRPCVFES